MAYRTECKKTVREFAEILQNFLTKPVSMDELDYSGSTGNGNIESIDFNLANVKTEQWTLTYDNANSNFTVSGSVSGSQDTANINTHYDNGIISFTIRSGEVAWQDGDTVKINCYVSSATPFKLITNGTYRKDLKAELQGVKNIDIQYDSYSDNNDFSFNSSVNNTDYTLGYAYLQCNSIDTSHKFNQEDVAIHTTILPTPMNEDTVIFLENFTSDSITSSSTQEIRINFAQERIYILGKGFTLYNYTENFTDFRELAHITINITNGTGDVDIYVNGNLIKSVTVADFVNASYRIYRINLPVAVSFYTWNRLLTTSEISTIGDNGGFPTSNVANDYYSSLFNNQYFYPYFIISPANKFGFFHFDFGDGSLKYKNVLSAKWLPTVGHIGSYFQSFTRYDESPNETYYSFDKQHINFGELDTVLDKFWIVTDGDSVLIAIKHFDPLKNTNAVYQMAYLGWNKGDIMYDYPVCIGMKSQDFNWWETTDNDYRFGITYNNNASVWYSNGWKKGIVETTQMSNGWDEIQTTDEFTTIIRVNMFNNVSGNVTQIPYGFPKWLYLINSFDITPETSFLLDGTQYIAIPDNYDSGSSYNYLIELNKY